MDNTLLYMSPFSTRYAGEDMKYIFSETKKFTTWHELWIALAKAEHELGLNVTKEQIDELVANKDIIDFDVAKAREKEVRHDVMSHIYAYGKRCPKAEPIIHLGATSCYVGDNTDVILMRESLQLVLKKLVQVMKNLSSFSEEYKELPCLGYTHLQPAQLTTVGKRASLWLYELYMDALEVERKIDELMLLGSKGTTGTQASFMELFEGDETKVKELDNIIAREMGFDNCVKVSGQTYSRKVDSMVLSILSGIAQSASKFSNDMRILQSFGEMEEPFEKSQIGSSAMPYKRNPMRSERITSISRYVIVNSLNPSITAATQWFERSLDDSANKRVSVPESFLAIDGILNLYINITSDMVVYPMVINSRIMEKLPFIATENIMMEAVKRGGNRQELHELLRVHSHAATLKVKTEGAQNDLIDRLANDNKFMLTKEELMSELDPMIYIGRSASQVTELIDDLIKPFVAKYAENKELTAEINV
ncbi:MAG: adenylosuccinate lyase [Peptostreptococcaceae bacterium]|nr:adenylosuccinate lyase [Peptostreptococcaceae bacterium]